MKVKQIFKTAIFAALFALAATKVHAVVVYNGALANETGLCYDNTYVLDLGNSQLRDSNIDSLTMQAVYSSTTFSAATFNDGTASTGTITVSTTNLAALVGTRGTNTLYVASNSTNSLNTAYFTLNGNRFSQGVDWTRAAVASNTAVSIKDAINNSVMTNQYFLASAVLSTVTITCVSSGTACNAYTLSSSTQTSLKRGSALFTGGVNHAFIIINGQTLTESVDWNVSTASGTAKSISDAIHGNSVLTAIINSTWTTVATSSFGVVNATSAVVGANKNYYWASSNLSVISVSNKQMFGGTDSAINTTSSKITVAHHGYTTGLDLVYQKVAGTSPGTLVNGTTYFAIPVDANTLKLAATSAASVAGTPVVAITTQTATGGGSFTLTPIPYSGTASFKWQSSNDGSHWDDMAVSSVTVSAPQTVTSTSWDFATVGWRYIRAIVIASTRGGLGLVITGVGRSSK